jgi:release factor glutamine methyltransferase
MENSKTWRDITGLSAAYLSAHGVENAETCCEWLMARLLGCGHGTLAAQMPGIPRPAHVEAMRRGVARLAAHEPLQYVLGEWDFRYLTLKTDSRALIPRPETEELVSRVLSSRYVSLPRPVVVDVGCGSGCITLALADEWPEGSNPVFAGVDISPGAVALARENAERTGLADRATFAVADGLDEFDPRSIDVIVSNPPYIPSAECERLDENVRRFEPRLALDGGEDGLAFYDRYLGDAINVLKPGGGVFFEIGHDQGPALARLFSEYGFEDARIEKDWAGNDRYAYAALPDQ